MLSVHCIVSFPWKYGVSVLGVALILPNPFVEIASVLLVFLVCFTMTCRRNIDFKGQVYSKWVICCAFQFIIMERPHEFLFDVIANMYKYACDALRLRACVCACTLAHICISMLVLCLSTGNTITQHTPIVYDCRQTNNINHHYRRSLHLNSRNSHLE